MIDCPQCHNQNKPDARFCSQCGTLLSSFVPEAVAPESGAGVATADAAAAGHSLPASKEVTMKLASLPVQSTLAEGELLCDGRFQVEKVLPSSEEVNSYRVSDREKKRCSHCCRLDTGNGSFCENCGVQLGTSYYELKEAFSPTPFATAQRVIDEGIVAAELVNVYESWSESPFEGVMRYYLLQDEEPIRIRLHWLVDDMPIANKLKTFEVVAKALDSLYTQNIAIQQLTSSQVWPVETGFKFDAIGNVVRLTPETMADGLQGHILAMIAEMRTGHTLDDDEVSVAEEAATAGNFTSALAVVEWKKELLARKAASPALPPPPLRFVVAARSDLGRVREINEDSLLTMELVQVHESLTYPLRLIALADGMGGHATGEVASRMVLNQLAEKLATLAFAGARNKAWPPANGTNGAGSPMNSPKAWGEMLAQACKEAARAVYDEGRRTGSDMGATLVAALLAEGRAYVVNIGDSRLYQLNEEAIVQITQDHSFAQLLVAQQGYTAEEAAADPRANMLYRSVGAKPNTECDLFTVNLKAGDSLLLCSDGLSGLVSDAEMLAVARAASHPENACDALVQLANEAAGHDNISVILVKVEGVDIPL